MLWQIVIGVVLLSAVQGIHFTITRMAESIINKSYVSELRHALKCNVFLSFKHFDELYFVYIWTLHCLHIRGHAYHVLLNFLCSPAFR